MLELYIYRNREGIPTTMGDAPDLDCAIGNAKSLINADEEVELIEIRQKGETICSVGPGWVSKKQAH